MGRPVAGWIARMPHRPPVAAAALLATGALLASCLVAEAHPHVFADSRMEIVGTPDGHLAAVRNIWRMDELFSSSVVFDFDKNGNGKLDDDELVAVGDTVRQSIAEWSFYTFVKSGAHDVPMQPPDEIRTLYENGQLLMFFEMKPREPVDLKKQPVTFAVFDESFFVAFDYADASSFQLLDMPASCSKKFTVPDPDEGAQEWMNSIATLGPDQSVPDDGIDYSRLLATHVDVQCG